jgi:predicted transcriptional regulator
MSRRLVAIRSDCDLTFVADSFVRTGLRHLIVVDADRAFLGIVTPEQVLSALRTAGQRCLADHVAVTGVRVHAADSVRRAAQLMVTELVDALPVVDDSGNRVVGIVSWSDIVSSVAHRDLLRDDRG